MTIKACIFFFLQFQPFVAEIVFICHLHLDFKGIPWRCCLMMDLLLLVFHFYGSDVELFAIMQFLWRQESLFINIHPPYPPDFTITTHSNSNRGDSPLLGWMRLPVVSLQRDLRRSMERFLSKHSVVCSLVSEPEPLHLKNPPPDSRIFKAFLISKDVSHIVWMLSKAVSCPGASQAYPYPLVAPLVVIRDVFQ